MKSVKGKCACSAIRYTIEEEIKTFRPCHCGTCQAWSGGVFLSIEAGTNPIIDDPEDNLSIWQSSPWAERGFCKTCGSSLYFKLTAPGPHQNKHWFCTGGLKKWDESWILDKEMYIDCKPAGFSFEGDHDVCTKAQAEEFYEATLGLEIPSKPPSSGDSRKEEC